MVTWVSHRVLATLTVPFLASYQETNISKYSLHFNMTRVTNLGRKRTYLEAGFASTGQPEDLTALSPNGQDTVGLDVSSQKSSNADREPPKKKRKRIRKKRPAESISSPEGAEGNQDSAVTEADTTINPTKKALKKKKWKDMEKQKKERREPELSFHISDFSFKYFLVIYRTVSVRNAPAETDARTSGGYHLFCLPRKGTCCQGLCKRQMSGYKYWNG